MEKLYRYTLEKYRGKSSRHTCPACGKKGEFTLYVDENGEPLDPTVGKCNRDSKCGYHYTPAQFFKEHPELTGKDWRYDEPKWLEKALKRREAEKAKPLSLIPPEFVTRSIRPDLNSDFTTWLLTILPADAVTRLTNEYRLGVTRNRDVIFFQIDTEGRCRTGKVMKYNKETGHRIKDEKTPNRITWVHSILKYRHDLPEDWSLCQCIFGEHLLARFPDKHVAIVESEKTAVLCAGLMPQYVWLATGGKSQMNERLRVLTGRDVTAFPDVDGYEAWSNKAKEFSDLNITVSKILQQNATPEEIEAQIDIADWLVKWKLHPELFTRPDWNPTCAKVLPLLDESIREDVKALIEDLDLVLIE